VLSDEGLHLSGQQNDPKWCGPVHDLFARVEPTAQAPSPHIWMTSLKFLLRHDHRTKEMFTALPRAGGTEVGEAVLLALEHAPELALPLIRKALLADIPINRIEVTAIIVFHLARWSSQQVRILNAVIGTLSALDRDRKQALIIEFVCWGRAAVGRAATKALALATATVRDALAIDERRAVEAKRGGRLTRSIGVL
jgi:hypothetical protein